MFDTPLGACAIVWGDAGVAGCALPGRTPQATRDSVQARFPAAREDVPGSAIAGVIERVRGLLGGARDDLADVALDLATLPTFHQRVYAALRTVGPGRTISYGELAAAVGEPGAARAVGRALGANPIPIIVPCHRVLAAAGAPGGFSAPGGTRTKLRLLQIERAVFGATPGLFD
jgi:methylated-DNA-[protein]-cysteine S-methyltransferase